MHEQIMRLAQRLYDQPVMDNRERGDYAEQLVASQIEPAWKWVGMGWHPWDFETGEGSSRLRMQVRQSAAKQIWKRPAKHVPFFATTIKPKPLYVQKNNPGLRIEDAGRFCEMYVFAWHGKADETCDHRTPEQWSFFVLPERSLGQRKSVKVRELESQWLTDNGGCRSDWSQLSKAVTEIAGSLLWFKASRFEALGWIWVATDLSRHVAHGRGWPRSVWSRREGCVREGWKPERP